MSLCDSGSVQGGGGSGHLVKPHRSTGGREWKWEWDFRGWTTLLPCVGDKCPRLLQASSDLSYSTTLFTGENAKAEKESTSRGDGASLPARLQSRVPGGLFPGGLGRVDWTLPSGWAWATYSCSLWACYSLGSSNTLTSLQSR